MKKVSNEKIEKRTESIYEILHTIGKKWSLELLELTRKSSKSYTELQKELGINSKLISAKLKEFLDLSLLTKDGDKYNLSKFGKKLMKGLKPVTKAISKFTQEGIKMLKKEKKSEKKAINDSAHTPTKTTTDSKTNTTKKTTSKKTIPEKKGSKVMAKKPTTKKVVKVTTKK